VSPGLLYLDSSALVKLVMPEPETGALLRLLAGWPERLSSALARVEVLRAARRVGDERAPGKAEAVLARVGLLEVDGAILDSAALLGPPELRSLDALHLASALSLGGDLGGMAVYDDRLARAARLSGIRVFAPGMTSTGEG
jgi:predicted nucleic acid-binding protein